MLEKGEKSALPSLYHGLTRLNECVENIVRSVGRYDVVNHTDSKPGSTSTLKCSTRSSSRGGSKPVEYSAMEVGGVFALDGSRRMNTLIYTSHMRGGG